jgi:hypothetical protein
MRDADALVAPRTAYPARDAAAKAGPDGYTLRSTMRLWTCDRLPLYPPRPRSRDPTKDSTDKVESMMFKHLAIAAVAAAVIAAASAPGFAQDKKKVAAKPESPAMAAMHARQKKCGAEWRAAKTAGKVEKGMKWPQYWSACNKRLKAAGG